MLLILKNANKNTSKEWAWPKLLINLTENRSCCEITYFTNTVQTLVPESLELHELPIGCRYATISIKGLISTSISIYIHH